LDFEFVINKLGSNVSLYAIKVLNISEFWE